MAPQVLDVTAASDPRDAVHRACKPWSKAKLSHCRPRLSISRLPAVWRSGPCNGCLALRGGKLEGPATLAVRSTDEVLDYVPQLPRVGQRLARRCWPGPVTLQLADAHPESAVHRLPATRARRGRSGGRNPRSRAGP